MPEIHNYLLSESRRALAPTPEMGGDVVAGGAALAGFILIYLGAVTTSFASYQADQQESVKSAFQRRAWFAVVGIIFALSSVGLGMVGKWLSNECMVNTGVVILLITLLWSLATAIITALDIY